MPFEFEAFLCLGYVTRQIWLRLENLEHLSHRTNVAKLLICGS